MFGVLALLVVTCDEKNVFEQDGVSCDSLVFFPSAILGSVFVEKLLSLEGV